MGTSCRWKRRLTEMLDIHGARLRAREHHEGLNELLRFVTSLRQTLHKLAPELENNVQEASTSRDHLAAALESETPKGLIECFRQTKRLSALCDAASAIQNDTLVTSLYGEVPRFLTARTLAIGIQRTRVTRLDISGWDTEQLKQGLLFASLSAGDLSAMPADKAVTAAMDADAVFRELTADINQLAARHEAVIKLLNSTQRAVPNYNKKVNDAASISRQLHKKLADSCRLHVPKATELNVTIDGFAKAVAQLAQLCANNRYQAAETFAPTVEALRDKLDALLDSTVGLNERLRKTRRKSRTDTGNLLKHIDRLLATAPQGADTYDALLTLRRITAAYHKVLSANSAVMPSPECLESLSSYLTVTAQHLRDVVRDSTTPQPAPARPTACQHLQQLLDV